MKPVSRSLLYLTTTAVILYPNGWAGEKVDMKAIIEDVNEGQNFGENLLPEEIDNEEVVSPEELEAPEVEQLVVSHTKGLKIPDQFMTDGVLDVEKLITSRAEQQAQISKQGNELGELRNYQNELIKQRVLESGQQSAPVVQNNESDLLDEDDFYDDPKEAVNKAVQNAVKPLLEAQEKSDFNRKMDSFKNANPTFFDDVRTPEFAEWMNQSDYRKGLGAAADRYDFAAAQELANGFNEARQSIDLSQQNVNEQRQEALKRAGSESGGGNSGSGKNKIKAKDVRKVMIENPSKYNSEAYQTALVDAIRDGRFIE